MKKRPIILIFSIALVAIAAWFFAFRKKDKPLTIITEKPAYGNIAISVTATGTVQPVDTVAVGSQISGTIRKIYVDFNSPVKKRQLLAELDPVLMEAQYQQTVGNLAQAESNLTWQQQNYNRQSALYNAGGISKADYQSAFNTFTTAQGNVQSLKAQVRGAQKNLSLTRIYSPINGTVLSRNVSEGQTVAASFNAPVLFSIANDLTKMQVRASVDEADIGNVKEGERVTFTVDAFPNDTFAGTVEEVRLEPTVSANVVTYITIINTPNNDLKLKPGMTANINVYTSEQNHVLLIPAKAIQFTPDPSLAIPVVKADHPKNRMQAALDSSGHKPATVWVKTGDTLVQKHILTGLDNDVCVEVVRGLTEQDEVVTGIDNQTAIQATSKTENKSPFMPTRGGGNSNRSSSTRKQ